MTVRRHHRPERNVPRGSRGRRDASAPAGKHGSEGPVAFAGSGVGSSGTRCDRAISMSSRRQRSGRSGPRSVPEGLAPPSAPPRPEWTPACPESGALHDRLRRPPLSRERRAGRVLTPLRGDTPSGQRCRTGHIRWIGSLEARPRNAPNQPASRSANAGAQSEPRGTQNCGAHF
jgi:hypothetical protein